MQYFISSHNTSYLSHFDHSRAPKENFSDKVFLRVIKSPLSVSVLASNMMMSVHLSYLSSRLDSFSCSSDQDFKYTSQGCNLNSYIILGLCFEMKQKKKKKKRKSSNDPYSPYLKIFFVVISIANVWATSSHFTTD